MKKILVFSLILMLVLALAGCGEDETTSSTPDTSAPTSSDDGTSSPDADEGQEHTDDGTIDLDISLDEAPESSTPTTTQPGGTTTTQPGGTTTTTSTTTAPTAGDFNDHDNWIEVPLG